MRRCLLPSRVKRQSRPPRWHGAGSEHSIQPEFGDGRLYGRIAGVHYRAHCRRGWRRDPDLFANKRVSIVGVIFARIGERSDLRRIHRGSATGTVVDSLCSGESYSPGAEATRFTITSPVTLAGSATGGFVRGSGGMGRRDGFRGARPVRP
jgi:hypothetical protein